MLVDHVPLENLSEAETDALDSLKGQLADIRKVKRRERSGAEPDRPA